MITTGSRMEPSESETKMIRRVRRLGIVLYLGFPLVVVASPFVGRALAPWAGGSAVGAYIVAVLLWLGFGARCPGAATQLVAWRCARARMWSSARNAG